MIGAAPTGPATGQGHKVCEPLTEVGCAAGRKVEGNPDVLVPAGVLAPQGEPLAVQCDRAQIDDALQDVPVDEPAELGHHIAVVPVETGEQRRLFDGQRVGPRGSQFVEVDADGRPVPFDGGAGQIEAENKHLGRILDLGRSEEAGKGHAGPDPIADRCRDKVGELHQTRENATRGERGFVGKQAVRGACSRSVPLLSTVCIEIRS